MNKNSLAEMVLTNFEGTSLPIAITMRFDILELLSKNELGETYLLSDISTGDRYVLKCFLRAKQAASESALLSGLSHKSLPKFQPEIWHDNTVYTLREYVDGASLEEYLLEHGVLTDNEAIHILSELCDVVALLHSQPTPIIHRDIKPSNIIINHDSIKLIDFGISRKYDKHSRKDTAVFVTPEYAPPEQYGFAQTDVRTDIYSIGILLRGMLTGTTSHKAVISNHNLHNIMRKCTALDPNKRYQSIGALIRALKNIKKSKTNHALRIAMVLLCFAALSWGGFLYASQSSRVAEAETPAYENYDSYEITYTHMYLVTEADTHNNPEIYTFIEPLVEAAVRRRLGIEDNEPLTYGQLEAITAIRIFGMYPSHLTTELMHEPNQYILEEGNILRLDDFSAMPNLRFLDLTKQPIFDLSPLMDNQRLTHIRIQRTYVSDISPLLYLPELYELYLTENHITDWSAIENMRSLRTLRIIGPNTNIYSISDLGDITLLNVLHIGRNDAFVSLEGLDNRSRLSHLDVRHTGARDFSPLNDPNIAPRLYHLLVSPDMERYLYTLQRHDFEVIACDYF